jgi:hypothetical protein
MQYLKQILTTRQISSDDQDLIIKQLATFFYEDLDTHKSRYDLFFLEADNNQIQLMQPPINQTIITRVR